MVISGELGAFHSAIALSTLVVERNNGQASNPHWPYRLNRFMTHMQQTDTGLAGLEDIELLFFHEKQKLAI